MDVTQWSTKLLTPVLLIAWLCAASPAWGQTEQQVRLAFQNIRNDDIPNNGLAASEWIYANRNSLKAALEDELYKTDRQGRDVILKALFDTKSFEPDARFRQLVVARLNDENKYVGNFDLHLYAHWVAWGYIHRHYAAFKPLILDNLRTTENMWCIWSTVWMLSKHRDLDKEVPQFDSHMWSIVARSLANDNVSYNASHAARIYLIIGNAATPQLQALQKSRDNQAKGLASALLDAMTGNRRAYGYLCSELSLDKSLMGRGGRTPEWLGQEIDEWRARHPGR